MRLRLHLTVRVKFALGFLFVAAVAAAIGGVGMWSTQQVRQMAQLMYQQEAAGLRHAAQAKNNVTAAGRALRSALLARTKGQRIGDIYFMRDFVQATEIEASKLDALYPTEQSRAMVAEVLDTIREYGQVLEGLAQELERASGEQISESIVVRLEEDARPLGEKAEMLLNSLVLDKQNTSGALARQTDEIYRDALRAMIALTIGGTLLAIGLGLMLTRSLTRQLGGEPLEVARVANSISQGNLATRISTRRAHSKSVIRAMRHMQESLHKIVVAVRESSESVADGSRRIATGNADLSRRTDEQALQLTQTAAAMEQLAATVSNNVDDASRASALASSTRQAAIRGGETVNRVVLMMNNINESSTRISDITSIIDSIAFQTNILALNAAVEAARAGTQGRGFAVVASEVRSLAQRSAEAAKDIKDLIADSHEKVDSGMKLASAAGESMSEMVDQVKGVTELINAISVATLEQKAGIEQVNAAVASLSVVTRENAFSVDKSANAAAQLNEQANQLVDLVGGFVLDDAEALTIETTAHYRETSDEEQDEQLSDWSGASKLGFAT